MIFMQGGLGGGRPTVGGFGGDTPKEGHKRDARHGVKMGVMFSSTTAPSLVADYTTGDDDKVNVFHRIAMSSSLSLTHRDSLTRAKAYVDADVPLRNALVVFNERLYDVDQQLSAHLILDIASFYLLYARLLVAPTTADVSKVDVEDLVALRTRIFRTVDELPLKVATMHGEPAYRILREAVRASLTSCTAALWHKHGVREAIAMYYPTGV